jgi:hypothetical protein
LKAKSLTLFASKIQVFFSFDFVFSFSIDFLKGDNFQGLPGRLCFLISL